MNYILKIALAILIFSTSSLSQTTDKEIAYTQVVAQRAYKITASLQLSDSLQFKRVCGMIAKQYRDLNTVHESLKTATKAQPSPSEEELKQLESEANTQLGQLHAQYISHLSTELSATQIEKIKDGMTYGVLPNTYRAYQEMMPDLTEVQKAQILAYLTEAREHAMDAESSEKKHAWFGKYKGKINNYLSAQGIDMKKAGQDWEKRIKEAQAAKK
ncbi:MAG: DUF3826 domain-containing protein [Spirosomataceae bacterium]